MTIQKGLSGTISLQIPWGKSRCLTDEADVSRTPNVNTADTYYDYKMRTFTFFYVRATNDL